MTTFSFLYATRFWAMVIGAASVYLKAKGWIGAPEMEAIATIMAVFVTVRTVDRFGEQKIAAEAVAAGQVPAATLIKIPPSQADTLGEAPARKETP